MEAIRNCNLFNFNPVGAGQGGANIPAVQINNFTPQISQSAVNLLGNQTASSGTVNLNNHQFSGDSLFGAMGKFYNPLTQGAGSFALGSSSF